MTLIYPKRANPSLKCNVRPEIMSLEILGVVPVRRPLDVPSANRKYGKVLSHSGVIAKTRKVYVLIEYMCDSMVYVSICPGYHEGEDVFYYRHYTFNHDDLKWQVPNQKVTIREFALQMIEEMKGAKFDTFTHNCHHARYRTMLHYGMKSDDPDGCGTNLFFQGFIDFFS